MHCPASVRSALQVQAALCRSLALRCPRTCSRQSLPRSASDGLHEAMSAVCTSNTQSSRQTACRRKTLGAATHSELLETFQRSCMSSARGRRISLRQDSRLRAQACHQQEQGPAKPAARSSEHLKRDLVSWLAACQASSTGQSTAAKLLKTVAAAGLACHAAAPPHRLHATHDISSAST